MGFVDGALPYALLNLARKWLKLAGQTVNERENGVVLTLTSAKRRQQLGEDARRSRASVWQTGAAWVLVMVYNIVGVTDIISTVIALDSGAGVEANPLLNALMVHAGEGWIFAKLGLQGLISFMVLWFPHWIVLFFFTVATTGNILIVANNFSIAGVF